MIKRISELVPEHECGEDCPYAEGVEISSFSMPGSLEREVSSHVHRMSPTEVADLLIEVFDDFAVTNCPPGIPPAVVWGRGREVMRHLLDDKAPPKQVSDSLAEMVEGWMAGE